MATPTEALHTGAQGGVVEVLEFDSAGRPGFGVTGANLLLGPIFRTISAVSNSNPVVQIPQEIDRGTKRKISGSGKLREKLPYKSTDFPFRE
jgi:hypothetical protein